MTPDAPPSEHASRGDRVVVALGGNALAPAGRAGPHEQQAAIRDAMEQVADLIESGYEVAITHGNGPQVGNLLLKNEIARHVVPPVPLDWCVAQTQATIGYLIVTALEGALTRRGLERAIAVIITRVLVDADDPAFRHPTKPIGADRRLVPSPEPRRILDQDPIVRLLDDGAVVVAAGGGGVPMVADGDGLRGVEAVIDKDLCAALLARATRAQALVIATDVPGVALDLDGDEPQWLRAVTSTRLRELADLGHFPAGSMGPKVQASLRFVEAGGERAAITSIKTLREAAGGQAGTVVVAERAG